MLHYFRTSRTQPKLALAAALFLLLSAVSSGCTPKEIAIQNLGLINEARAEAGAAPLQWDEQAATKAQAWAERMAAANTMSHSEVTDGMGTEWNHLGENVGYGKSIQVVHGNFLNSQRHYDTMVASKYTSAGVGVAFSGKVMFVAEVYRG